MDENDTRKVAQHWGQQAQVSADARQDVSWLDSKLVQRLYLNPGFGGDPDQNWLAYFKKRYVPHTVPRAWPSVAETAVSSGMGRPSAWRAL